MAGDEPHQHDCADGLPDPATVTAGYTQCRCGNAFAKFGTGWRLNHILTEMLGGSPVSICDEDTDDER